VCVSSLSCLAPGSGAGTSQDYHLPGLLLVPHLRYRCHLSHPLRAAGQRRGAGPIRGPSGCQAEESEARDREPRWGHLPHRSGLKVGSWELLEVMKGRRQASTFIWLTRCQGLGSPLEAWPYPAT
jgi:hypothetical protein